MTSFEDVKKGLYRYEEPDKGWVIVIKDAESLIKGAEKVRDAGIKRFDCFTPFPIHNLQEAMGLSRSWVPFISAIGALTGGTFAFSSMTWIDTSSWPRIIGGKPPFSWPIYLPITFELTVLFTAFATLGITLYLGRLGKSSRRPVVNTVTSDGFAIWIGDDMSKSDVEKLLQGLYTDINPVKV
ncbi:MAG: DUF3341 domain-containing protein [Spirochaetia bacterium]|nr:DUF3341 domain-containing protein [Spirochaetia bacterium]